MRELFTQLEERLALGHLQHTRLTAYLAGGMAVHLYTGKRITTDVDAEFSARVLVPKDLAVEVTADNGDQQVVYFDTNYNPMFAMLHEDYQQDAIAVDLQLAHIQLRVLSPVDLAVSKIARFAANDQEDIRDLVRLGLTSAADIEARANQALLAYIGDYRSVFLNIRDAIALASDAEQSTAADPSSTSTMEP